MVTGRKGEFALVQHIWFLCAVLQFPGLCLQVKAWVPRVSSMAPQVHLRTGLSSVPSRMPTATRSASSVKRSPHAEMVTAFCYHFCQCVRWYCAERFNCSVNDLIYGRLPIIIYPYVCNSVDKTTLDRVAYLRELIVIRDSSLTLSGLLSSDKLNDVILHACTS